MKKLYGNDDHELIHVATRKSQGAGSSLVCSQSGEEHVEDFDNATDAEHRFDTVCDILEQSGWRCIPYELLLKGELALSGTSPVES